MLLGWRSAEANRLEPLDRPPYPLTTSKPNPFRCFETSSEIIRLAVMMHVRFPLSLRNVEDLLHERGIDVSYKTIRFWRHRFGPMFAVEIRNRRIAGLRSSRWRWHLDEMFVKIKRSLTSRGVSKLNRTAALREWRQLGAA